MTPESDSESETTIRFDTPRTADGAAVYRLIKNCPPLDVNTCYAYLLICHHFSATSVVARRGEDIVGFISAYRPPDKPDALFVWQVAVDSSARGQGLAGRMLSAILERPALGDIRWIETTISPSNEPSQRLFQSIARRRDVAIDKETLFTEEMFAGESHEAEELYRLGPFER